MTDYQIATYCDAVKETTLRQFYTIQNQRKELAILNRKCTQQQAEIERLQRLFEQEEKSKNSLTKKCYKDGIKEFAEKLKKLSRNLYPFSDEPIIDCKDIDNLAKELVGDK